MNKIEQITVTSLILTLVLFGCMIYLLYVRPSATHIKKLVPELRQKVDKIRFTDLPNIQSNISEQIEEFPNYLKSISSVHVRSSQENGCDNGLSKFLANGCDMAFNYNQKYIIPAILGPSANTDKYNWEISRYPS